MTYAIGLHTDKTTKYVLVPQISGIIGSSVASDTWRKSMGIRLTLLALGFLVVSSAQAQAQAMGHGHGTTTAFVYNNLTFRYDLQDDDFKKSPTWNPETEESPLSTRKALDIARANLQRFVLDAEKFEIEKIDLERFEPHKWVF